MNSGMLLKEPLQAGSLMMRNRVVMAPLTRCRAIDNRVPNALMAEYYRQRAGAGMILSEATAIDPMAVGYPNTPGIWNTAHIEGWKPVTDAVHAAGGLIVLQLWHVGRISDPVYLDGKLPLAPSALQPQGTVSHIRPQRPFVVPRAIATDEISAIATQYHRATANARLAGFDGVELHGANGYLIDQFLHPFSNHRDDAYGGSIENHARFLLEMTDAAVAAWQPGRVGIHLSPRPHANDMRGIGLADLYAYVARQLGARQLAFICLREPLGSVRHLPAMRAEFGGVVIANQEFTAASAEQLLHSGEADAVAFGRLYISNPDLAERFFAGAQLTPPVAETFYGDGATGYTDYPMMRSSD